MPDGADEKTFPVPARADMMRVNLLIMESDATLLDRYATLRDEAAFRQIVERHAGMVLGVARRRTQDAALGEEAGQIIFTLLARKAAALRHLPPDKLGGWLHRTALLTAGNLLRSEMRRQIHHQRFASENATLADGSDNSSWAAALPLVDEAIDSLPEADRKLVVEHFYQRRTFREMSTGTGRTEDALRKRAGRALERLSAFFKRRGVTLSAGAILTGLSARVTEAAPSGYAAAAAAAAMTKASSLSTLTIISNTLATMALTKLTVTAAAVAFFIPLGLHWSESASVAPPADTKLPSPAPGGAKGPNTNPAGSGATALAAKSRVRSAALARFAQELAKVTPPPADEQRLAELQRLAFGLTEEELPAALQLLRGAPPGSALETVVAAVAARWAEFDPVTALRMTASLPKELHVSVWSGALQVWARRDFNAAFAWTCQQPDGEDRNTQLDMVYNDLMKRDPASAMTRLAELPTEAKRQQFRRWTLEVWRNSNPDAAIAWLTNNGPEEKREREITDFIHDWASYRPDLTFAYTLKYITSPHQREDNVRWALMQWGMHDPPAAIAAVVNLPQEMQTAGMARNAAPFIALGDPAAFLEATRQLPAGEFRDNLQVPLIHQLAAKDIPKARQMMEALTTREARQEAAMNIGVLWLRRDPAAARQWIEATPELSEEYRTNLLKESAK